MDSKEDTVNDTSLLSGSVSGSVSNSVSSDTNGFNSVNKVDEIDSSKAVSSLIVSSDDENEGFQEAFESILDDNNSLVVGDETETLANVDEGEGDETFSEAPEFHVSKADDVEKDDVLDSNLNSDLKEEVGDKVSEDKEDETEVVVENGVKVTTEGDSVVEEIKVEIPVPGVTVVTNTEPVVDDEDEDEDEDVVLVGGSDDSNAVVETGGFESDGANDVKVDPVVETVDLESADANDVKVDSEVSNVVVETPDLDSVGVNDVKVDSDDGSKVVETVDSESAGANDLNVDSFVKTLDLESVGANEVKLTSEVIETPDLESVGERDAKVTSEGDSVVESIDVDLPIPGVAGVAVVTNKEVETPEIVSELVGGNDVKVTSVVESIDVDLPIPGVAGGAVVTNKEVEIPEKPEIVSELVGGNDVKVTSEEDSVVENIDVDLPIPGVGGVAVVMKTEEDGGDVAVIDDEKIDRVLEEVVDKEVVGVTGGKFSPLVEDSVGYDVEEDEKNPEAEVVKTVLDDVEDVPKEAEVLEKSIPDVKDVKEDADVADNKLENGLADKFVLEETEEKDSDNEEEEGYIDGSPSDDGEEETDGVIFGSSEAAKQFMEELQGGESSQDRSQLIDGQIATDSDEEDDEEDGKELFDSAALTALLKAAADGGSEGGNITFSSQDGSRLFTVERPAGLGSTLQAMRSAPRQNQTRSNIFNPSSLVNVSEAETNLTEEERKKLEKLQSIRVKFLRLVHKLGLSPDESVAAQVLYRLALIAGRQTGQSFSLDSAKQKAMELEANGNADLDFSVNILVIGKGGVGKSATINSIFGEEKTVISAFQPATSSVKEIRGMVGGVMVRVFDTPGLRTSVMEQGFNRSVLSSVKKLTKKNPLDIVLYVDRLDTQTRDHNDIPLLNTVTTSLGQSIWRSAIVTFTHGASAPPEGSNGVPLSYEMFVTQRSHVVQQAIGKAVGDMRMMSPSLMNPVTLVENHEMCRKNRDGQKVLPNGQTWRPQLLMLCYSMKILAEANSLTKPHDPYDSNRKLFGFRVRSPPLPYMLSSMLQSRPHPKLGDGGESDADMADLTDSDVEDENEEDEYDQLPPFKPLKKSQLSKLSREQKKAYFDEYDYRVKLLQKKQWKEEVKRMKEMKKRGKDSVTEQTYQTEEGEEDAPAPVAVPLPDMALPPSFDSDNPAYRFRFLEPTSQFLARPVLDTHGWDHDCGYDGVNVEQTLAILSRFPASVSVQVTKDKKDFTINMDSSVSAKHGGNMDMSSMVGFDIQPIGKQLAYIVRGETKFKNLKKNKTAAGISVTFLGENVVTGFKVEDHITLGRQYSIVGSAGTVRFQTDSAYGANIEIQRRENEYPIGQVQSTFGLSIIKWRGDLALGFNSLAQFSVGRNSKVAVRAGINNKMSGQITVKTSSSEYLSLALAAVIPSVISAYKKLSPEAGERYNAY